MGKIVTVKKVMSRIKKHNGTYTNVTLESKNCSERAGWITGFRNMYFGTISHDNEYGDVFTPTEAIPIILVAYWPTMQPAQIPTSGFVMGGTPCSPATYEFRSMSQKQRDDHSEYMRKEMENWPRDKKGRWLKER